LFCKIKDKIHRSLDKKRPCPSGRRGGQEGAKNAKGNCGQRQKIENLGLKNLSIEKLEARKVSTLLNNYSL